MEHCLFETDSDLIEENAVMILYVHIRDHGEPRPCRIVETLRLFFGSNQTDWRTVMKNNHHHETALVSTRFLITNKILNTHRKKHDKSYLHMTYYHRRQRRMFDSVQPS